MVLAFAWSFFCLFASTHCALLLKKNVLCLISDVLTLVGGGRSKLALAVPIGAMETNTRPMFMFLLLAALMASECPVPGLPCCLSEHSLELGHDTR
jgi:hypothetical protein